MKESELKMAIMKELATNARCNKWACDDHDIERSAHTAGRFTAFCSVLRLIGNEVDDGTYNDNGCDRIAYLRLNGELLMRNCNWQDAYWKMFQ